MAPSVLGVLSLLECEEGGLPGRRIGCKGEMFVDRVRVKLTAGAGGNGCVSFRREAYVPRGGPNGGDGGDGGSIYFVASTKVSSLVQLRFHYHYKAERGEHGQGKDCRGKWGKDTEIPVPLGTVIRDFETNEVVADLVKEGERYIAVRGGRGGRGNARFTSPTNRAPKFAEKGEPGEEKELELELKVIAEVGLVGLPNAGKSTFLAAVSAATPKIADYPFTTLSPNLGVARLSDLRTLTVADIPGIIEGAAQGKGLGHEFLRHIERTQVLLFLIDLGDADPARTYEILENELAEYSPVFADRPRLVALNKVDISENREKAEETAHVFDEPAVVSAATGEGVPELLERLWRIVDEARKAPKEPVIAIPEREYTYEPPFQVEETPRGFFVTGRRVTQVVRMTNFENEEAIRHMEQVLHRMGLFRALRRLGAREGQTILIGDIELEYHPD